MAQVHTAKQQTFGGYIYGDGVVWVRIKVPQLAKNIYLTINKGWGQQWKAVGGWCRWGAMTTDDAGGRDTSPLNDVVRI